MRSENFPQKRRPRKGDIWFMYQGRKSNTNLGEFYFYTGKKFKLIKKLKKNKLWKKLNKNPN